ncbi:MAG: CPBP family intramembrane metalloprotease [Flavobacteriaceae bacterium]|nr:CPBP family intramembrane metalloprotease [Flavobacteriaceae bacterium]
MFIAQAFKSYHDWWRYAVGIIIVFIAAQLGSIPFILAATVKVMQEGGSIYDLDDVSKLMTVLDSNLTLFLMLLSFAVGLAALLFVIKYLHKQPLIEATTTRKKIDWNRFFVGFGLVAITTIVLTAIDYNLNPQDYEVQFQLWPFLILALVVIIFIPLQTSMEEYLFRGYLMQGIGVLAKNRWLPLILTSVLFGALHLANPEVEKLGNIIMVYYIGTGFLLGIMTLMDEGLELALGFHAGNNMIAALLVTADWTVFSTNSILKDISEPAVGIDIVIPVLILYPIYLLILARKYKWKNWSEKLFGRVEKPVDLEKIERDYL